MEALILPSMEALVHCPIHGLDLIPFQVKQKISVDWLQGLIPLPLPMRPIAP